MNGQLLPRTGLLIVYLFTVLGVLWILVQVHRLRRLSPPRESFAGPVDDLQGDKALGVKIGGTRQLIVEKGGLRFTPGGSSDSTSLLQDYERTEVSVGGWTHGSGGAPFTGLSPMVQVQRTGKWVIVQVQNTGSVVYGSTGVGTNSIESTTPLPDRFRPPPGVTPNVMVLDQAKRTSKTVVAGLCTASLRSDGTIVVETYNRAATFGAKKTSVQLDSFVLHYLV